jgi:integrase/recombinase XerD
MRKLTEAIKQIEDIGRKYQVNPAQYNYITKTARKRLKLVTPKVARHFPDFLTAPEAHQLLENAKMHTFDALLLDFLMRTGLRIAEARNLRVEHIDFNTKLITVVQGKNSKDRQVPLLPQLQSKLLLFLRGRTKGYVFCRKNEAPYSIRALQYKVTGWLKTLNLPKKLSTHSLRRTYGCMCLANGVSLDRLQILMGHEKRETTEIYAKLTIADFKDDFIRLMVNGQ